MAKIDFGQVKAAALAQSETLVPAWLPAGKREGPEWVARNPTRDDGKPGSFKINLLSGLWGDFATGDKGGEAGDRRGDWPKHRPPGGVSA